MASSGKKGKKTKGTTLALTDFLQKTPGATPTIPIRKTNLNWADEVEDVCDQYDSRSKANVVLPTAPKASRGLDEFTERIPQQPPYIAYLSNLPYDVNEDEIADFFGELKISNMRIPREDRPGDAPRLKGFGYVEFEDRESLVGALSITDCTLKNRRIRIEVATNLDNDRRRGGRMDNNRDRSDRSEVTSGDWRSGPRVEPSEPERTRGGGGFNRDRDSNNFERDRGTSWRDASDRPSFRDNDRDRGFHRDGDRGGGFRDGGYGDRNRFSDRDGGDKRSFGPRRNEDREFVRGGGRDRERDDAASERSEPRTRPKLVLAPRTKPVETVIVTTNSEIDAPVKETLPTTVPTSSSIFGNAKPVDTSARERQIEARLAREQEKPSSGGDSGKDGQRDTERRGDWGKKDDDDSKWGKRRYSPRRNSPGFRRDNTPNRRRDSYDRKRNYSPDDKKRSPSRSLSPEYRKESPERRRSLDRSPEHRKGSPDKYSPERKKSVERRRASPPPPERRRGSPDKWKKSPDRQANRGPFQKKDDKDKRAPPKNDRPVQKNDKDKHKRDDKLSKDNHDREMPKVKEPEPPNFAASNKFAFLQAESDSD